MEIILGKVEKSREKIRVGIIEIALVSVASSDKTTAVLHDIVVQADRRGEGIGSALVKKAEDTAVEMGASVLRLAVEPGAWMLDWYDKLGFRAVYINRYQGRRFIVMEKNITRRESVEPQTHTESAISSLD